MEMLVGTGDGGNRLACICVRLCIPVVAVATANQLVVAPTIPHEHKTCIPHCSPSLFVTNDSLSVVLAVRYGTKRGQECSGIYPVAAEWSSRPRARAGRHRGPRACGPLLGPVGVGGAVLSRTGSVIGPIPPDLFFKIGNIKKIVWTPRAGFVHCKYWTPEKRRMNEKHPLKYKLKQRFFGCKGLFQKPHELWEIFEGLGLGLGLGVSFRLCRVVKKIQQKMLDF